MAAQLQTRIERIPSGLRRIIITIVVLVILAFLFPLSDDDRRREPNGAELLIPTFAETQPASASMTPETAAATASVTAEPSETSESQAASPSAANTSVASTARPSISPSTTASNSVMTPPATHTNAPTSTPRVSLTPRVVCTPSPQSDWEIYTVRRGDTLQGIARLVDVSIEDLIEANCLDNPDHITVGQQLWAPALPDPFATLTQTPRPVVTPTSAG